ncbi:MAG: FAD:protein FMN transferase [Planctomycetota bacterium]|nr:FAD:protein FMN transferase [Planctomycetota bacterium]
MRWSEDPATPFLETYSRPGSGFHRFPFRALGTENVLLLAADEGEELRRCVQEAFRIVESLEGRLSKFLPESDVSLANSLAASRPVHVGEDLLFLLERAREAWEISGGAFDPTVGPLLEAWGLVDRRSRAPPSEDELRRLLELRGMDRVTVDRASGTVRYDRAGVAVDLGGMGKGYIVDRIADFLRGRGIEAGAVISGRSTLLTWGTPPGEDHWRLGLVHPDEPQETLATFLAEPGAVSSSGAYERFVRRGTEVHGHVLDPRSGRPARAVKGTTVWSRTALLGDVLSTLLFVLGDAAAGEGGPAEQLATAWTPEGEAPRASFVWIVPQPAVWGGLEIRSRHVGEPALRRR